MISKKGFTLIELLITMLIFSIIIAAVYSSHATQQKSYQVQGQVAEMQQNFRAALSLMTTDIRMAGFDPLRTAGTGIMVALPGRLQVTLDANSDGNFVGDPGEMFDFGFAAAIDGDDDGIPDVFPNVDSLGKQTNGGGYQPIADNIQAIEFLYLDSTGTVTAILAQIRSVQITILARSARLDPTFINSMTYTTPSLQVWGPYNDNFRRRMLTTTIWCRNL